ncbi:putative protein kinase RLK-Pelle-RLCK-VIII family [Helianthus annuus]|nr:putative protein kinase RLK-Pelle-RLCK-VIII family [Helianthus annuus]KAJ0541613.1 putative protein kinase RLK-Pelle-RLCK-VIII family [Helianthus annuus]KAJ0706687.1 putative protein kinase RLK-Pelle-RLCK-VIII family [Helianthus annuus]KAJ0839570.1 putative protein kinase RLK-Pelle-RLCK-VIII family [Helianthus annuus]KAJ0887278.1 putative protein kinase RLK-Pelle-RLCK-VIII family [Helianthus annuus]
MSIFLNCVVTAWRKTNESWYFNMQPWVVCMRYYTFSTGLRVKIAYGAARGLQYLHEKAQPPIVILSNLSSDNAARLHSTRVLGTFGYHAPEYVMTGQITQKSDVYSFGVILLELLTRRKPMDHTLLKGQQSLITWALCYDGIQRLLGISQTVGTVPDALPLPISTLLSTFTLTHNPDV